jgi:hypothetical protein
MEHTPHLSQTLVQVLSQPAQWVDQRHLKSLAWRRVGLMHAGGISLTAWAPEVVGRAQDAQSPVRRCRRWRANDPLAGRSRDGPCLQQALGGWGEHARSVACDPSRWWHTSGLLRLAGSSRGRALPLGGAVLPHGRAPGACAASPERLDRAAWRWPRRGQGIWLAARGCAATARMAPRPRLGGHGRMRLQSRLWLSRRGRRRWKVERLSGARGHASLWPQVGLPAQRSGPGPLGVARPWHGPEMGSGLRDAPTAAKTCEA